MARKLRQRNQILERAIDRCNGVRKRSLRALARRWVGPVRQWADGRQDAIRQIERERAELVRRWWFFDANWYRQRYPDVAEAGIDPLEHYLREGAAEGRNPSPFFDTNWYLAQNPDIDDSGVNPLVHYVAHGAQEGRTPVPSTQDLLSKWQPDARAEYHDEIVERLIRDNQALCQVIQTILERSDEILDSRPWRLGKIFARIERPFRKLLLGDRRRFRHLNRRYIRDVSDKSTVFQLTSYPVTGMYDDIPVGKVATSVGETLTSLWEAVGVQLQERPR